MPKGGKRELATPRVGQPRPALARVDHVGQPASLATLADPPIAVVGLKADTAEIQSWSNGACALFGVEAHEVIGRRIEDLVFARNRDRQEGPLLGDLYASRQAVVLEAEARHRSGALVPVEMIASPLLDADGQVSGHTVMLKPWPVRDRPSVEASRTSEARLQFAADLIGLGSFSWNPNTGKVSWDDKVRAMFGLPAGAPVQFETFIGAIHPDDRKRMETAVEQAMNPDVEGPVELEYRVLGADGNERWLVSRGQTTFQGGRPVSFDGVVIDITPRKKGEEATRRSLKLVEHVMSSAPVSIYIHHVETGRNELVSKRAGQLLGYDEKAWERLVGTALQLMHPDDLARLPNHFQRVTADLSGEPIEFEYRMRHADGGWRWFLSRDLVYERAADGRVIKVLGTATDITENKASQDALRTSEAFLREVLNSLPQRVCVLDVHGVIVATNKPWLDFANAHCNDPGAASTGASYLDVCRRAAEQGDPSAGDALRGFEDLLCGRRASFSMEYPCHLPPHERWFVLYANRVSKGAGAIIVSHLDITERKQAERAVRESEQTFRAMFSISSVGKAEVEPGTGRILRVNAALCELTGYSEEELLARTFGEITHPDDRAANQAQVAQLVAGDISVFDVEKRYVRKDGIAVWARVTANVIRDEQGRALRNTAVIQDITERKKAELQLAQANALLECLFETAPIGIGVFDEQMRFLRINHRLAEMNGLPVAGHLGRRPDELLPDLDNVGEIMGRWRRILETGEPWLGVEISGVTPADPKRTRHWMEHFFPLRVGGKITGLAAVVEETTQRKEAEQALRESEERFRTFVTTAQEGIWAIDRKGRTLFANPRMAELLDTMGEVLAKSNFADFCFDDELDIARDHLAANLAGETEAFEMRLRRGSGEPLFVLAATAPLRAPDGAIIGALGGFLDLTERKRAEERQHVLMRELAHRGKNLLAVMQSIASRTLTGERTLDEAREAFTGRLQALANTYSSLTDEAFEGAPLKDIVAAELLSFGDRVHVQGPRMMLTAKVAQTFTLVLHELGTNAAKYGALSVPDGHVSVEWRVSGKGEERRFVFEWRETGGPPAKPPTRRGFGTTLISAVAGAELKCKPEVNYGESGFSYSLDAALSDVGAAVEDSPVRQKLRSETLIEFYDAWAGIRQPGSTLPALSQFNRERFEATGGLTIAELDEAGDVRFVSMGHALTERLGKLVDEYDLTQDDPGNHRTAYRRCMRGTAPCYEHLRFDFGDGNVVTFERLLLPFARSGKRPTHVAGLVVFSGDTGRPGSAVQADNQSGVP